MQPPALCSVAGPCAPLTSWSLSLAPHSGELLRPSSLRPPFPLSNQGPRGCSSFWAECAGGTSQKG